MTAIDRATTDDGGVTVLLVEDDPDDARFVERLVVDHQSELDRRGPEGPIEVADVARVGRLADGLERVRTDDPDVVLLDLMLPDSEGLETVAAMVERAPAVPVVVLTGRDETGVGVEAIRRGAEDYLVKGSIDAEVLLRTLGYAIERQRTRRELRDRNHRLALLNRIVGRDIRDDASLIVGRADQLRGRVDPADEPAVDALLEAAGHVVDLADTASELVDALSSDDVEREPRDLNAVLDAEVARLRRERDVSISVERYDSVDDPLTVYASSMLESAFEHLLSHAVDRSDREMPRVTVTVDASPDRASIEIDDDGPPIPDWQREVLADPRDGFERGSRVDVRLYLAATVVTEVGGEFEIADDRPRGTTVTIALDRVRGE